MERSEFLYLSIDEQFRYLLIHPKEIRKIFDPYIYSDNSLLKFINDCVEMVYYQYSPHYNHKLGEIIVSNYSEKELVKFIENSPALIHYLPKITVNMILKYIECGVTVVDNSSLFQKLSDEEKMEFYIRSGISSDYAPTDMLEKMSNWMGGDTYINDDLAIMIIRDLIRNTTDLNYYIYINEGLAKLLFPETRSDNFWKIIEYVFPEGCLFCKNITSEMKNSIIDRRIAPTNKLHLRYMIDLESIGGFRLFYPLFDRENPADTQKLMEYIFTLSQQDVMTILYGMSIFKSPECLRKDIREVLVDFNPETSTLMVNIDEKLLLKILEKPTSREFLRRLDINWNVISDTTKLMAEIY